MSVRRPSPAVHLARLRLGHPPEHGVSMMRALLLPLVAGLAAASAAMAQPASGPGDKATLCLDPGGVDHAPLCRSHNATRFVQPPDICVCDGPYRQVEAPWCAKGEKPPNDTAEFERARAAYAM